MIEIKGINWENTLIRNAPSILLMVLQLAAGITGLKAITTITDPALRLFGTLIIVYMIVAIIRLRITWIYNSKEGTIILED